MNQVAVIGAGFAGLSAASALAKEGMDVTLFEKNESTGGRARQFRADGFTFDMGPSWYWMPDVFERFFNLFGKTASDYYPLVRLDPSYRVYFGRKDYLDVPAGKQALAELFETLEPGSAHQLTRFLEEGRLKYQLAFNDLVHKPGLSVSELLTPRVIKGLAHLHVFQPISTYVRKFFRNERIVSILEFPVLFLGATPSNTPALYSLMNYADMELGTWYPRGGMYKIVEAMTTLARSLGVRLQLDTAVSAFQMNATRIKGVWYNDHAQPFDYVVAAADYHHVEQHLLPPTFRKYSTRWWDNRVMAPSSLIFYLGISGKINALRHHTLFFDEDFNLHAEEIYKRPAWPTAPQFYVSCPSKTDPDVAPEGFENVMVLIPVAPGLKDTPEMRERYFNMVIDRMESLTGEQIRQRIVYKRSYAHADFISDYNAYKGNAYGLANTLLQTANLKPRMTHARVSNLFYAGQLTVPGPGVPPAIVSGQVAASVLLKKRQLQTSTP